ncbi:aldehyde dehydrogenase family protein [Armatimonas sp.]|uniref:aldehyde dehydrogenase family protein n=1 Tax=Armatimonas sp. TaxID=1872638 RepID=UPI0037515F1C
MEIINPATGDLLTTVAAGSAADIDSAVQKAQRAFEGEWGHSAPRERTAALQTLAAVLRDNAEELAQLECANVGKPIGSARGEIGYAARVLDYYAGLASVARGETVGLSGGLGLTLREPLGVCGLIVPWNFPLVITLWKLAPALAMGNTAVIKPAEWTPLTVLRLAELAKGILPEGVLNVVTGTGTEAGAALVAHPGVRKISFTGSTVTGRAIMASAAQTIKRVSLELGGKSASLVFADADLEKAAGSVMSVFDNTGQDCCARSRYLVEKSIFHDFVERFVENTKKLIVGDPLAENTDLGPLVAEAHRERVHGFVARAGIKPLIGGEKLDGPGCFYPPTVFTGVTSDSEIAQQEIFGPVVTILPFETEAEAIALANNTLYGLSGSLWTQDAARAMRVARAVRTGALSVNSSRSVHLELPFGGYGQSGLGRELGPQALDAYSEVKSVYWAQ